LQKKLAWILSRYHIKVLRYPGANERLEVFTWPSGKQGIFALRDFEIKDQEGRSLLVATSSWILLNLEKKQPTHLNGFLPNNLTLARRALPDDFSSFPQIEKAEREVAFRVLMKDLDFNKHVNNTVYIQWALEAVPPDVLNSKRPIDIEVSYRAEAFYGEEVASKVERKDVESAPSFLHQIVNKNTGTELTRLKTVWGTFP
jgi:medium-chain acyl-[acyl-carrier-protein] hydrolase